MPQNGVLENSDNFMRNENVKMFAHFQHSNFGLCFGDDDEQEPDVWLILSYDKYMYSLGQKVFIYLWRKIILRCVEMWP